MKKTHFLALLLVFSFARVSAATVQAEAMLNNIGSYWRLGMRASYSEMINDNSDFKLSLLVPNHEYFNIGIDGKYSIKRIFPILFGGLIERKFETTRTGAIFGAGVQTPSDNFHFHLKTTLCPQITQATDEPCWELCGEIGWKKANFDTYFRYRHKRTANNSHEMSSLDFIDFHVKMISTVTSVYIMMDLSAFQDLSSFNPGVIDVNASTQVGMNAPSGAEYFIVVGYNREISDSDLPLLFSFGTKFNF